MPGGPIIVVEDDPFTRLIPLVLEPQAHAERRAAFADFMAHDEPDFEGWCARVRAAAPGLAGAEVRMVSSEEEMRKAIKDAVVLVIESFRVDAADLDVAEALKVVQKFGTSLRNIDTAACAARGVRVRTIRRRANVSCAEHAFGLMLMLARKLGVLDGLVSVGRIEESGRRYRPYDRRHTPGGNYPRLGGTRALHGSTIGIIGFGEIGREIAKRAAAFEMRVLYHQRTRAPEPEERECNANHVSLATLMAESDWIVPQVPTGAGTRGLIGRAELAQAKPGACVVNVSNAPAIDREALIEALRGGRLGGAALDVHYREPVDDDDPLLAFDNVILTPRMAGSPRFNGLEDFEQLITELAREIAS
jgi:phosphoglycerate dehydrogenase-like enzyme